METKKVARKTVGADIEMKQDNLAYPGNPVVEGAGAKLKMQYIVGKKPEVKHTAVHNQRTGHWRKEHISGGTESL